PAAAGRCEEGSAGDPPPPDPLPPEGGGRLARRAREPGGGSQILGTDPVPPSPSLPLKGGGSRMRRLRANISGGCAVTELRILSAGPGVTLQDGGRHGYLRFGVTAAGPMDPLAFATANAVTGADQNATAIEVSLGGVELAADKAVSLAIAGGAFHVELSGRPLPSAVIATLEPGQRLVI